MKGCRKILIAVNDSKDVLVHGLKLACDEKCWVTVLKVIPSYEGDLELVGIKNIGDILDSGGQNAISEIKDMAKAESTAIKTRLEKGDVSENIVNVAEEERCDLIIMGANKRQGIKKLFSGSVLEKVINHAPCSVMVVRNKE